MRYIAYAVWGMVVAALLVVVGQSRAVAGGCGGCGGGEPEADSKVVVAQKTCPVMGGAVNKEIFVDYNGRRIYFCCNGCPETFKKDPAKYLKIVDKQLKDAKPEGAAPGTNEGHAH
jgi:YHS domain-containing protein